MRQRLALPAVVLTLGVALASTGCGDPEPRQYAPRSAAVRRDHQCADLGDPGSVAGWRRHRGRPDGHIRAALKRAKVPLRDRAGESTYYSAAAYDQAADAVLATIDPLIDAYDEYDETNPSPLFWANNTFARAQMALEQECTS